MLGLGIPQYEMSTLEDLTKTVLNLKEPVTMRELHRLIDMIVYHRNLIQNFAKLTRPLNELKRTYRNTYKSKLIITERSIPACQQVFDKLRKRLTTVPILTHQRFDRPYILYTDTLWEAFRAVLCQIWRNEDCATTETHQTPLVYIALGDEDWETDYMSNRIFRSTYVKGKVVEDKKDDGFWIDSIATLHYHTQAGDCICLHEGPLLQALQTAHNLLENFGRERVYKSSPIRTTGKSYTWQWTTSSTTVLAEESTRLHESAQ